MQELVERCVGKMVHVLVVKGTEADFVPEDLDWTRFGKLLSSQLTGKNKLETEFSDILRKKYPKDF